MNCRGHLQIFKCLPAPPAVVVLQYRADHDPRPVLLKRHMEVLPAQLRFNMWRYRVNGLCVCCVALNSCIGCVCKCSIPVQCSRSRKRRNNGVQQRRIVVGSTGPRGKLQVNRTAIASWRLGPTRCKKWYFWRLNRGPRGPNEDPTRF
jgi:hypothetical protein